MVYLMRRREDGNFYAGKFQKLSKTEKWDGVREAWLLNKLQVELSTKVRRKSRPRSSHCQDHLLEWAFSEDWENVHKILLTFPLQDCKFVIKLVEFYSSPRESVIVTEYLEVDITILKLSTLYLRYI